MERYDLICLLQFISALILLSSRMVLNQNAMYLNEFQYQGLKSSLKKTILKYSLQENLLKCRRAIKLNRF